MSFDLVLFGGTGDLAWRKLMPALFQAFRHGSLPEGGRIIGVARDDLSDDQYRELIASRFQAVEGWPFVVLWSSMGSPSLLYPDFCCTDDFESRK